MFGRSTTRAPPITGRPAPFALSRYYRYDTRPLVIGSNIAATLWALLWGISAFQNIGPDNSHSLHQLVPFDIILGSLYMGVAAIEIFGIISAFRRNLPLMRIYAFLSIIALLLTSGAEIVRIVVHFLFKKALIDECTNDVTGDLVSDNFGFFGSHNVHNLSPSEAADYCQSAFDHDTFTDIAWLIVGTLLGLLFVSIAYSYYHQLLDPSSVASRFRTTNSVPLQTFGGGPGPYNPPQGGYHMDNRSVDGFVPPYDAAKLPGYGYSGEGEERDMGLGKGEKDDEHVGASRV